MSIVVQIESRRQDTSRRILSDQRYRTTIASAEDARECLADKNRFIAWAQSWVTTPRTIMVRKGGRLPTLRVRYPVVVKPSHGVGLLRCPTHSAVLEVVRSMKGAYQVQECLASFAFIRLYCNEDGVSLAKQVIIDGKRVSKPLAAESQEYQIACGVSRRLVDMILRLGIKSFFLTIAVRQQTAYVIGCRPDSVGVNH